MKIIAPVDIKAGQELEIGILAIDGKPITVPPSPGTDAKTLWHYEPGMVDVTDYNRWAFEELANKPKAPRTYIASSGLQLYAETPHMPPLLMEDGRFLFDVRPDSYDHHCDLRPGDITEIGKMYHHSLTLKFSDASRRWLESTGWAAVIQHWQRVRNNPPFALMVKQGQWAVQQYGAPDGPPADNSSWPIDAGARSLGVVGTDEHQIEIEYRPHPTDGMSRVVIDGKEIYRWEGSTCIAMPSGQGTRLYAGLYTDKDEIEAGDLAQVYIERLTYSVADEPAVIIPDPDPLPAEPKLVLPAKDGVVLKADQPWEKRIAFGSIARTPTLGLLAMYYVVWTTQDRFSLAVAYSTDNGDTWDKSPVGHYSIDGVRTNIVIEDCVSAVVYYSEPDRAYIAEISRKDGGGFKYVRMLSVNGLAFEELEDANTAAAGDIVCGGNFGIIHKDAIHIDGQQHREFYMSDKMVTGLAMEGPEDAVRTECYGISVLPLGNRYLGFEWLFPIAEITARGSQIGSIYPRVTVSDDLLHWSPVFGAEPIIPLGQDGEFDSGMILPFSSPIVIGDEVHLYYSGSNYKHSKYWSSSNNTGHVGRARWRLSDVTGFLPHNSGSSRAVAEGIELFRQGVEAT